MHCSKQLNWNLPFESDEQAPIISVGFQPSHVYRSLAHLACYFMLSIPSSWCTLMAASKFFKIQFSILYRNNMQPTQVDNQLPLLSLIFLES